MMGSLGSFDSGYKILLILGEMANRELRPYDGQWGKRKRIWLFDCGAILEGFLNYINQFGRYKDRIFKVNVGMGS